MKGVILAGGLATRLRPLTWLTNKHLLPIYNKPMIYFALESMARAGIRDVLITSSPDHCGDFINLLKSGSEFNLKLSYAIQDKPGGISEAILLAKDFVGKENVLVILGDNIFFDSLATVAKKFDEKREGSVIFAKKMPTESKQYGVVEMDKDGNVLSIEEKPEHPKSDLAQTGIYIYDSSVFSRIENLKPSKRGELEVTDLNNSYLKDGKVMCEILEGLWIDAGTSYDELLTANIKISEMVKKNVKRG